MCLRQFLTGSANINGGSGPARPVANLRIVDINRLKTRGFQPLSGTFRGKGLVPRSALSARLSGKVSHSLKRELMLKAHIPLEHMHEFELDQSCRCAWAAASSCLATDDAASDAARSLRRPAAPMIRLLPPQPRLVAL